MNNLAVTYYNQGRLKEAEVLLLQVIAARNRVLGEEHPDTLNSMGSLAATFQRQGRLAEAQELNLQLIATPKRLLG